MDISPRCRIDEVRAATDHAQQLFAGRIGRDHEFVKEHAAAGWAFVRIAVEPYVRSAAHSPCGGLVAAVAPIILTRGGGQRAYWYSLSLNPEVRHRGFHFIARSMPTPSFQSIQQRSSARPTQQINGRAESLAKAPAYHDAFQTRRCAVPAVGFFEWVSQKDARRLVE